MKFNKLDRVELVNSIDEVPKHSVGTIESIVEDVSKKGTSYYVFFKNLNRLLSLSKEDIKLYNSPHFSKNSKLIKGDY